MAENQMGSDDMYILEMESFKLFNFEFSPIGTKGKKATTNLWKMEK